MTAVDRPRPSRRRWIAFAALSAALVLVLAFVFRSSPGGCYYEDTVWLRELPSAVVPDRVLNLTAADLSAHPYIGRVVDAYRHPGAYPPAHFQGDAFLYPVPPEDHIALRTDNDFLVERWGIRAYPLNFTLGDGTNYSWEVSVSDPGYFAPCG